MSMRNIKKKIIYYKEHSLDGIPEIFYNKIYKVEIYFIDMIEFTKDKLKKINNDIKEIALYHNVKNIEKIHDDINYKITYKFNY